MQALRTSSALLRLVLACYLLVLGIAGASPVFHPQRMEVVCSADGAMKMVAVDHEAGEHTLDCSLCLATALPAPELQRHRRGEDREVHAERAEEEHRNQEHANAKRRINHANTPSRELLGGVIVRRDELFN